MSSYAQALRSVEVRALLTSNLISSFRIGLLFAAVPLVIAQAGGGGLLAGLAWALHDAPGVLLSTTSGKLAARPHHVRALSPTATEWLQRAVTAVTCRAYRRLEDSIGLSP